MAGLETPPYATFSSLCSVRALSGRVLVPSGTAKATAGLETPPYATFSVQEVRRRRWRRGSGRRTPQDVLQKAVWPRWSVSTVHWGHRRSLRLFESVYLTTKCSETRGGGRMTDDESRYQHFIIEKPENYEIWRLSKPDTASPTEPLQPERVQAPPGLGL